MRCVLLETPLIPSEEEVKITTTEVIEIEENNIATEISESEDTQHPGSPDNDETDLEMRIGKREEMKKMT